jgi:hypothetical protein
MVANRNKLTRHTLPNRIIFSLLVAYLHFTSPKLEQPARW